MMISHCRCRARSELSGDFSKACGEELVFGVVDGDDDQRGALVGDAAIDCGAQVARTIYRLALPPKRVGQLLPVWVAEGHVDMPAVLSLLFPSDETVVVIFP